MALNVKRLVSLILFVVVSDILDLYSTYLATPDLSKEFNLLVRDFGWGWWEIIMLHAILLLALCFFILYHVRNEPDVKDAPCESSFNKLGVWYIFGLDGNNRKVDVKIYLAFLGLLIPAGTAINGIVNFILNMSYHLGYFAGLNDTTFYYYNIVKAIIIIACLIVIIILRLKAMKGRD